MPEQLTACRADLAAILGGSVHQVTAPIIRPRRRRPDGTGGRRGLGAGQNSARTVQTPRRASRPPEGEPSGFAPGPRQVKRGLRPRFAGAEALQNRRHRVASEEGYYQKLAGRRREAAGT